MKIKTRISFDEYSAVVDKVVNDAFIKNVYSPAYYDLSLRTALLNVYAPEYKVDGTDNNTLYDSVYTDEANEIFDEIKSAGAPVTVSVSVFAVYTKSSDFDCRIVGTVFGTSEFILDFSEKAF